MTATKHALVIGGGIAGPTAAMALQRADIASTVYEAYPENAESAGAFLTVAVNGIAALRTIGLDRPVMEAGFPTASIEFASGTGKGLGQTPIGGILADGTVAYTIRRPDLYRVLSQEARRRGVRIEYGKRLVDAQPSPGGGVIASFEDGSSARGDLLIGADGIHSRVRRIIDPAAPAPRYTGMGNVGGYSRATVVGAKPGTYVMIFGKRAFFGYVVSPAGEVWWFANPARATELSRAELHATQEAWKARLIELFRDDAGPAVDIIQKTTVLAVTNQHDLPRVPKWSRGPMIVIGDATHAQAHRRRDRGRLSRSRMRSSWRMPARQIGASGGVCRLRAAASSTGRARGRVGGADESDEDPGPARSTVSRRGIAADSATRREAVPGVAVQGTRSTGDARWTIGRAPHSLRRGIAPGAARVGVQEIMSR